MANQDLCFICQLPLSPSSEFLAGSICSPTEDPLLLFQFLCELFNLTGIRRIFDTLKLPKNSDFCDVCQSELQRIREALDFVQTVRLQINDGITKLLNSLKNGNKCVFSPENEREFMHVSTQTLRKMFVQCLTEAKVLVTPMRQDEILKYMNRPNPQKSALTLAPMAKRKRGRPRKSEKMNAEVLTVNLNPSEVVIPTNEPAYQKPPNTVTDDVSLTDAIVKNESKVGSDDVSFDIEISSTQPRRLRAREPWLLKLLQIDEDSETEIGPELKEEDNADSDASFNVEEDDGCDSDIEITTCKSDHPRGRPKAASSSRSLRKPRGRKRGPNYRPRERHYLRYSATCPDCPEVFRSRKKMNRHRLEAHNYDASSHCRYCGIDFNSCLVSNHSEVPKNDGTDPWLIPNPAESPKQQDGTNFDLLPDPSGAFHQSGNDFDLNSEGPEPSGSNVSLIPKPSEAPDEDGSNPSFIPKAIEAPSQPRNHPVLYRCNLDNCQLRCFSNLPDFRYHHHKRCLSNPTVAKNIGKTHQCDQCGMNFKNLLNLRYHISSVHEKTYKVCCEICGKGFPTMGWLTAHIRTVHDKTFCCQLCGDRFKQGKQLKEHLIKHSGEKPFVCEECGKAFHRRELMKKHKQNMHNSDQSPCPLCGKLFKSRHYVRNHLKNSHGRGYRVAAVEAELRSNNQEPQQIQEETAVCIGFTEDSAAD